MTIELYGIVLHGFHGVLEDERRDGQRFLVDVELDLEHEQAARSDRIEDAIDYREVVARVRQISDTRAYHLLEAFAAAIADALVADLPVTARARARAEARRRPRPARRVRSRQRRAPQGVSRHAYETRSRYVASST